jgi:hypothetical protein
MTLDEGQTHYVGDGCQPGHDPAIDQATEYAATHFYAQGQQWVPESELVASNKEIGRLQQRITDLESSDWKRKLAEARAERIRLRTLVDTQNEVIKAVRSLRQRGGENPSRGVWPALHEVFDALDLLDSDKAF